MATDPVSWQMPTLQAFERIQTPEEPFQTPPALDPEARPKCRAYTPAEWANIKPIFTQLYINRGMTLGDVIQHLKTHCNFHPTIQMCKNRITSWGLSKNAKAADKQYAVHLLNQGYSPTTILEQVPLHKILRYQKSLSKRTVCANRPNKVVKPSRRSINTSLHGLQASRYTKNDSQLAVSVIPNVTRSLALPADFADTDLFLRATQRMMLMLDTQAMQTLSSSYIELEILLVDGLTLWAANASSAACGKFSEAADTVTKIFRDGIVLDVGILFYLFTGKWKIDCHSMLQEFARFVSSVTVRYLGKEHPMTLIIRHLHSKDSSHDEQLRMWDCILDNFVKPEQRMGQWWEVARLRWECCRINGMYDLAARYCREAATAMRTLNHWDTNMEMDVLLALGELSLEQRDDDVAREYFEHFVRLAQVNMEREWKRVSITLCYLAQIDIYPIELGSALTFLERAFRVTFEHGRRNDAYTIDRLADLLRFCEDAELHDEIARIKQEYAEPFNDLEKITEGMWNIKLDDNLT